ncbi:MAG: hypothetical protein Q8Q12_22025, partial [bacterium]|nr:hypothetical protein [bacterium]
MSATVMRKLFGLLFTVCLTAAPYAAWSLVEDFGAGFDPADWEFSGNGASHDAANGWLVLTSATNDQTGSAFLTQTINATKFDASFRFYIGDGSRADGMTFCWLRPGSPLIGGGGGSLGFYGGGLDGYGVVFDEYSNRNHVSLQDPAIHAADSAGFGEYQPPVTMHNGGWFDVEIEFDNGHFQMWMANEAGGMARTQALDVTISGYEGFDARFGFTGATGGANNNHWADDLTINKGATAPSDFRVYGGDLVTLTGSGPENYTLAMWSQVAGLPAVTLTPTGPLSARFTAPSLQIGTILTFRFSMTTPDAGTTFDDVNVTVTAINAPKPPPSNIRVLPLDLGAAGLGFRTIWDPLVDAEQYDIGLEFGGTIIWLETIGVSQYEVKGLTEGQTRTIAIRGRNKHGASEDPASRVLVTSTGRRNLARPASLGGKSEPTSYVYAVSHYTIAGMNNIQYDDNNDSWNGLFKAGDYWGYLWGSDLFFDRVAYYTGNMFGDGGWFLDLKVQYTKDAGTTWADVPVLRIIPPMDFADDRAGKRTFTRYDLVMPTVRGNGIRVYGTPGGSATFTSIAELEVFGNQSQGPLVVQGIDAEYPEGATALLDGNLTFSTAGPITSYQWTGPGGITITNPTSAIASFKAPNVAADTEYVFSLQASDGTNTGTDADVRILVKNLVTTAVAGPDQSV